VLQSTTTDLPADEGESSVASGAIVF